MATSLLWQYTASTAERATKPLEIMRNCSDMRETQNDLFFKMRCPRHIAAASVLFASITNATLQIVPGATWTATTGKHIQAHGGTMIRVGNTYYWVGEDKTDGSAFQNVNCYSSTNLVEWKYEGALLSRTPSGDLGPNRVVERLKVIYNKTTKKYVLWMHIDSSEHTEARAGVATGDTVCGKYTYIGASQPLGFQSRDIGLFQDDDNKAYLLTEDRANGLRIDLLSADYLSVKQATYLWNDSIEAPAVIKKMGSILCPWSAWKTFADSGSKTYSSQTNYILPVGNNFMYMGDRWFSSNLMRSTYVWLPLAISTTTASMSNAVNWTVDASSGSITSGPSESTYEGESATLAGGAKKVSCAGCSGSNAAGYIGGSDNGAVTFSNVQSSATTRTSIRVKYCKSPFFRAHWLVLFCAFSLAQTVSA
ncbi:galactan 1,3-beta-galactosidase [Paraphaeosphaeria minitans]|uniref:Galactan 1,3-beta-galactosidase n=1 Tax=Paraphaeosphaeria minitans TaxID=565426 RepID=A0A9P6G8I6_9PLEO|nr:galactan 1,3-beta-galactosidase [Paraphaeosphaeria minitans]